MDSTNKQNFLELDPYNGLRLASFLDELGANVTMKTPTEIDNGGCGYYAMLLNKKLKEIGIPCQIIAIHDNSEKNEQDAEYQKNLKNFLKTGDDSKELGVQHVLVEINNYIYVDSMGIKNNLFYNEEIEKMPLSEKQIDILLKKAMWSPVFDTDCVPIMEQVLDEAFELLPNFKAGSFTVPKSITKTKKTVRELKKKQALELGMSLFGPNGKGLDSLIQGFLKSIEQKEKEAKTK